tara:strand:+ start:333 stop:485 length:153 start_codon:yes stop_codon:yes gene_type:complete
MEKVYQLTSSPFFPEEERAALIASIFSTMLYCTCLMADELIYTWLAKLGA